MKIKPLVNKIIYIITIIMFILISFFLDLGISSNEKEIENIVLIAFPCIMLFIYSLEGEKRKKYLKYYLIAYLLFMINAVFSNHRITSWTFAKIIKYGNTNLIPFKSIYELLFIQEYGLEFGLYNVLGNFLMLTPLAILLPLLNDNFKKTWKYALTILSITFVIEIIQHITNMGTFDIDDIILNFSGSFILYLIIKNKKVNKFINYVFIEMSIKNKFLTILYYIFGILSILTIFYYIYIIYEDYQSKLMIFDNLYCISDTKTYLGDYENYHVYSACEYGGYIISGKYSEYDIYEYFKLHYNEKYDDELNLIKEEIITDVIVTSSGYDTSKLILTIEDSGIEIYYVGIESIDVIKDGTLYNLEENYDDVGRYFWYLVELEYSNREEKYGILTGKYFNSIACYNLNSSNKYYIVSKELDIYNVEFDCN